MYRKPPHVAHARDGDATIVLHMERGEHVALSAHGTKVWELLLDSGDAGTVVERLAAEYADADPAVIEADVRALLDDLVARDLLDAVPDSAP